MGGTDQILLGAQAARDDDAAVLGERLADGVERFLDGGVDEAAGVDDNQVGAGVVGRGDVALGAQLREDALGVDERFRTAQAYETNLRTCLRSCLCCQRGNRGMKCR